MEIRELLEKSESLIAGFASAFTTTARLLEQYFNGWKFSVYDARSIGEACSLKGSTEDIERILYTYILTLQSKKAFLMEDNNNNNLHQLKMIISLHCNLLKI